MTNVLLFDNHNYLRSDMKNERIELFARTLNDAFEQFQSLWDDYKEVLDKFKESKKDSPNVLHEQLDPDKTGNVSAENPNKDKVSDKESIAVREKKTVDRNPASDAMKEIQKPSRQDPQQSFLIFSQDFCTQGLEETFINQGKTPVLREIQNSAPKRSRSPIFSSKKSKPRISSLTTINSPNMSQKSVVILDDFTNETTSNCEDPCVAKVPPDTNVVPSSTNPSSSLIHLSFSNSKADATCTPKHVREWGLSTVYNVDTNLIPGSKKKLKRNRIYRRRDKFTDLSNCNNVFVDKLDDRQMTRTPDNARNTNCSETSDSSLEESLIQVSPNHEKGVSKMRQKISRKNKSAETLQQKFNMVEDNLENIKDTKMTGKKNENTEITDTEITLFEPKLASTQYIRLPICSSRSVNETSVMKSKLNPEVMLPTNDSNMNDETLFIENQTPISDLIPKKIKKKSEEKKTSLPEKANSCVNLGTISENLLHISDKELNESEIEVSLDILQVMQRKSLPKKITAARSDFNPLRKKRCTSPTYVYKRSPVRKRAERALLNGWECHECEKYYKATGLTGDELQKRKNQCSRHRSKFNERNLSQKGYWNPDFSSSFHSTMWNDE